MNIINLENIKTLDQSIFNLQKNESNSLAGKFLIATPYSTLNEMFNKSLIYVISHSSQGAVGLIVNRLVNKMPLKILFKIIKDDVFPLDDEKLFPVYLGGPVESERGFVLHTNEYNKNLLFEPSGGLAVSSNIDILKDIVSGTGPVKSLFFMGYTGWEARQLEKEIENNFWIISESDDDIIFSENDNVKWYISLKKLGISSAFFSPYLGHA